VDREGGVDDMSEGCFLHAFPLCSGTTGVAKEKGCGMPIPTSNLDDQRPRIGLSKLRIVETSDTTSLILACAQKTHEQYKHVSCMQLTVLYGKLGHCTL
jgi:hypothetical protein